MTPPRRRPRAAAFLLFGLAAAGTGALAQETNTIGPPQLKDYSLPGRRTVPAASPAPGPTPATPPRIAPSTARAPAAAREPAAPDRRAAPAAAQPSATRVPPTAAPVEAPALPQPQLQQAPELQEAPAQPARASAPAASGRSWRLPAFAAGGLLLLGLATFLLRRRRAPRQREAERNGAGEGATMPAPNAASSATAPEPPPAPRPWLELDIAPERAAATDAEASVHYALTLANMGDVEARNIRIDARLFNAGAEGEIMAFLQGPIHETSGSPHIAIAPGATLKLMGQVKLPKAELAEIEVAGRRIFVPAVAINVAYDWAGGGAGSTSRSWLVGREAETPSAKMGPFRLDLGPRIYRSVGRREGRLVRV
jgi:hypothetical protein